jgi:hypothetical protein
MPAPSLALWSLVPSLQATTAEAQRTLSTAARVSLLSQSFRPGASRHLFFLRTQVLSWAKLARLSLPSLMCPECV